MTRESWVDADFEIQREKERNAKPVLHGEIDYALRELEERVEALEKQLGELLQRLAWLLECSP